MKTSELLIVPIDRAAIVALGEISGNLIETDDLQYESITSIENALLLALAEYWADFDWTGIEFFLECSKAVPNEMMVGYCKILIRKLAETIGFPRLSEAKANLRDAIVDYRETHFLSDCSLCRHTNTLTVRVEFNARVRMNTW